MQKSFLELTINIGKKNRLLHSNSKAEKFTLKTTMTVIVSTHRFLNIISIYNLNSIDRLLNLIAHF